MNLNVEEMREVGTYDFPDPFFQTIPCDVVDYSDCM